MSNELYNITIRAHENYSFQDIDKTLRAVLGSKFFKKFKHLETLGVYKETLKQLFECEWVRLPMSPKALARLVETNSKLIKKGIEPVLKISNKKVEVTREPMYIGIRSGDDYDSDNTAVIYLIDQDMRVSSYECVKVEDLSNVKLSALLVKAPIGAWLGPNQTVLNILKEHKDRTYNLEDSSFFLTPDGDEIQEPSQEDLLEYTDNEYQTRYVARALSC